MNFHVSPVSWTNDRVETLIDLFKQGLSATKIAERLGGCTRNAVIGKIHRLGLNLDHLLTAEEKADLMARKAEAKRIRDERARHRQTHARRSTTLYQMFVKRPANDLADRAKHIPFIELEPNHCRFPYGTGPYTFCGHDKHQGYSYCAEHVALTCTALPIKTEQSAHEKRPTFSVWA